MRLTELSGVGEKRAALYKKLGVETVEQLTELYPRDYVDYTQPVPIRDVNVEDFCVIRARVQTKRYASNYSSRIQVYRALLSDGVSEITAVFFNTAYQFDTLIIGSEYLFYGKITSDRNTLQIMSPQFVSVEKAGLIPKYRLTAGLSNNIVSANVKSALELVRHSENLPQYILDRYSLMGADEAIRKIHFPATREDCQAARKRLVFEELLTLRLGLSELKNRGRLLSGAVMADVDMDEFYSSLPFTPTNAQLNAINDCIADMKKLYPMNRLVQGDVGSGKTMVAAATAYFACKNGFQSLVMAPTEVLAQQHCETFKKFLNPLGVRVEILSGSMSAADKKRIKDDVKSGDIKVLVGTHALIQKSVNMAKLGLIVVDEQHRFGVSQRATLAEKGINPHIVAMSATPIPRTLALIVYGDLDVSIINEMPKGRLPVITYSVDTSYRQRLYAFIKKYIAQGRQAFIVCSRVQDNEETSDKVSAIEYYTSLTSGEFSGIPTGLLYGKMKPAEKDAVMNDFRDNKLKLLISTTVIEVGVDVPNAVVMLIENAEQFGLSQLHQLRGRVGRGSEQSYCVLMTDNKSEYTRERMKAMCDTTDGYKIADTDLKLRGPGNFFGREQSGAFSLKIADLAENSEVLGDIEELATNILADDPKLKKPENAGLLLNVQRLMGNIGSYGYN